MQTPKIFSVILWCQLDALYIAKHHMVAGFDSVDAERRLRECDERYLTGDMYIQTDECVDLYPKQDVRLYVGGREETPVTQHEYSKWVDAMTTVKSHDGEPPMSNFRKI